MAEEANTNAEESAEEEEIDNSQKSLDEIEEDVINEEDSEDEEKSANEESDDKEDEEDGKKEDSEDESEEADDEPAKKAEPKEGEKALSDYKDVDEYVYDQLPTIKAWGQEGESGKLQEFEIKSGSELPDNFIPRSYKDSQVLAEQLADQRSTAQKLKFDYEEGVAKSRTDEYREQMETAWDNEVQNAINAKEIPEIKVKDGDPNYWEDEGVKAVADVIKFMGQENERLDKIGAPYRVQSFAQAKQLFDIDKAKKAEAEEEKKDAEVRKQKGGMVSSSGSNSAPKEKGTPYYRRGDDLETVATKALDDLGV